MMPTYTYKCESCQNVFEKKQRMSDEPLQDCILCSEGHVRRVINSVGIVFKGNGFYVTDNRGKKTALTSSKTTDDSSDSKEKSGSEKTSTDKNADKKTDDKKRAKKDKSPATE